MDISNYILKLTGKAELPQAIEIGHNYRVALEGSVVAALDSDNEDGTLSRSFTFKPIKVEVLTATGETIKAKDTRSNSQLLRALVYKKWVNAASSESFDDFYQRFIFGVMRDIDELVDRFV